MLNLVPELAQNDVRYIERALSHEVNPDALRAYETGDLLDLIEERFGRVVEEEMGLVEEEHEPGFFGVAGFRQLFE